MQPPLATLIHISDLHFGSKFTTDETLFRSFVAQLPLVQGLYVHSYQAARALATQVKQILNNRKTYNVPSCLVFTGDLTAGGREKEFEVAEKYLRKSHNTNAGSPVGLTLGQPPSIINGTSGPGLFEVPGNHDLWQIADPSQLAVYQEYFGSDFPKICSIQTRTRPIFLYGLNSNQSTKMQFRLAEGRIREKQLEALYERLRFVRDTSHPDAIQIVCLHHPLGDHREKMIEIGMKLIDREEVASRLLTAGAHLVLAGHVHCHYILKTDGTRPPHVIAGTAIQQCAERNFWVIDIYETAIQLQSFVYSPGDGVRSFRPHAMPPIPLPPLPPSPSP